MPPPHKESVRQGHAQRLLARHTCGYPSFKASGPSAGTARRSARGTPSPTAAASRDRTPGQAELYGSKLQLRSGRRLEPRPVAEHPCSAAAPPSGGEVDARCIQEVLRAQGALGRGLEPLPPGGSAPARPASSGAARARRRVLLDFWRLEYEPKDYVDPAKYERDMAEPSEQELGEYIKTLGNTAAGPSNFSYAMVKFLWAEVPKKKEEGEGKGAGGAAPARPEQEDGDPDEAAEGEPVHWGRKLLLSLVAEAIRLRDLPDAMCQGNILGITKQGEWDGDIDNNLRPITLQEVALKLTTGLLNARLSRTIHENGFLRGANYGFRPGCSTDDALHVFNAVLEDAKQYKKPVYVLLQDIRRAYDSVSWESMELSMRRLLVPEGYIELHRNIFRRRRARAISGHGLSDEFELECGLPQGGVESPLHWLIFYDALLCAQVRMDQHERECGKKVAKTIEQYAHPETAEEPGTAYVMGNPRETDAAERAARARVSGVAYADDTKWMSGSLRGLQAQADEAGEFFRLHDIEVNAKKTIFTWNNARRETESKPGTHPAAKKKEKRPSPPKINGTPVGLVRQPHEHFKLLGPWR
eukprot:tig00020629_g12433.t1